MYASGGPVLKHENDQFYKKDNSRASLAMAAMSAPGRQVATNFQNATAVAKLLARVAKRKAPC